jgi:hypothetical protein
MERKCSYTIPDIGNVMECVVNIGNLLLYLRERASELTE